MVAQPPVPEKLCEHSEGTSGQCLINEWLLLFQGLGGAATGQGIFALCRARNLGISEGL